MDFDYIRAEVDYLMGINGFDPYECSFNTRIGLDLVKVGVRVVVVDWDRINWLCEVSNGYTDMFSEMPSCHIKYTVAIGNNFPLNINGNKFMIKDAILVGSGEIEKLSYSSIVIEYPHWKLRLVAGKPKTKDGKIRWMDTEELIVKSVPLDQSLGNLNNCSVRELQDRVREIIRILSVDFGISLDPQVARLDYVEVNRNLPVRDYGFGDILGYVPSEWTRGGADDILLYCKAAFRNLPTLPAKLNVTPSERPTGLLGVASKSGIFADASTFGVHIYQKSSQIERESEKKGDIVLLSAVVTRIEFVAKRNKICRSWFRTDDLFMLSQETVEQCYFRYLEKYVIKPFRGQIERLVDFMSQENVDTSRKNWTDAYAHTLVWFSEKLGVSMRFVKTNDIRRMLKELRVESGTIKHNFSRCVNLIIDKCEDDISVEDIPSYVEGLLRSEPEEYKVYYYMIDKPFLKQVKKLIKGT